jgi:hypothetical protein
VRRAANNPMTPTRNATKLNRGWRGRRDRREGRNQRIIRRAFAYADVFTTIELAAQIDPWVAGPIPEWRLQTVRRAAERWATRVGRRSRPLRWRAKPEVFK